MAPGSAPVPFVSLAGLIFARQDGKVRNTSAIWYYRFTICPTFTLQNLSKSN